MSNEVTVHNIADTVREKVKGFILESIPKEQFDSLIKTSWDNFFKSRSTNWEHKPSEFESLVASAIKKELELKIEESIKKELEGMRQEWSKTGELVIKDAVAKYAPEFIRGLSMAATQGILQSAANNRGIY